MTIAYDVALRNAMLNEIATRTDAGPAGGFLRLYSGTRPSTGGTATTLLAELQFSNTAFAPASGGVLTANAISPDVSANANGTATWFRVVDSTGSFVFDGDVGLVGSGADLELNTTTISVGLAVAVTSFVITEGNP